MEKMKLLFKVMKRGGVVVLSAILFSHSYLTYAQINVDDLKIMRVESDKTVVWKQVGPGNAGFANLLRYHPTIPGKVVLCPDMWNVYQSDNNGTEWYSVKDYDGDGRFYHIRDLYYSPSDENFGLAICSSELWKTEDLGRTWSVVGNCPWYKINDEGRDQHSWLKKVASLAINPNDKNVWFVGGGSNVRGQEWLSCYRDVTAANPRGSSSDYEGMLWRTTDSGTNWSLVNSGLDSKAQVGRIIVNPKESKQVFAGSNYGIYKSVDGGSSWSQISNGKLDNDIVMDMDFYYDKKTDKFILYAIDQVQYVPNGSTTKCTGGVFYSDDEGLSWNKINGNLGLNIARLTGGVPDNYYKFIANWLGITTAAAKSTYPSLPTNAVQFFNMISADPSREGALYIGFADPQTANSIVPGRLWTTSNYGKEWINTARLYEDTWEKDKAYWEERGNPWHENMEVGHSSPHMRFGANYALRSMRGMDVGVDGSVMIISDHSTMLSTDHGVSWKQVDEDYTPSGAIVGHGNSNLPGLTIAQDLRFESTLLGSGEHNLWIPTGDSPDDRLALKFVSSTQPSVNCIAFDPYDAKIVYATSSRQENKQNIFKSTDGGRNWENYGVATPATNKWLDDFYTNGLIIDPINNQYMYLGITKIVDARKSKQGGFFYSDNYGKTFKQSNSGLPSPARINDVKFDPRDNSMASLFIAAEKNSFNYDLPLSEGGLYHSSDRGKNWMKVNTPSSVQGVQFIEFDHTNRMYLTTGYRGGGSGVWYTDDYGENWTQIFAYPSSECIAISPFDYNLIAVSYRFLSKNPGVYISRDRGLTWSKSNIGLCTPHQIEDIKFDIHNPEEIWLATLGCGFYKGKIENGEQIKVIEATPNVVETSGDNPIELKATFLDEKFVGEAVIWKSENPEVATVDENGMVTPIKKGHVKIWATTADGRYSDFSVVTIKKNVSLNEMAIEEPFVYPNPVSSELYFNNSDAYSNIKVINIYGQVIKSFRSGDLLNVSELLPGFYLLSVDGKLKTQLFKFFKI